jgi:hypothetical protein
MSEETFKPVEFVANRIVERYNHPSRTAYLYMFWVAKGTDTAPLIPDASGVIAAWVDEGDGLIRTDADDAVKRGLAALEQKTFAAPQNTHERRTAMARSLVLTIEQTSESLVEVDLLSRALHSAKAQRHAYETWKPTSEGNIWYSAYRPEG